VVVVNIGYATRRGRIIRKILTRVPKVPDFFLLAVYFLFETLVAAIIIYACTVNMMIQNGIISTYVVFRFLDILAWSFPPTFPIYFNISYSFSLVRLKWKNILGTEPEKVTEAAMVKTFCFDKTGTLTQNEIEVYSIIKFVDQSTH
jgi:cation-transporting P-type ATPase 13A2